ncbi:hypothetical protein DID88_007608 [Monilinia fructigena]|uniref:RNase H type-1 domain-containing protein n=1 Tax=Monilinia fructigena TaxID=38457 RepID=A0A395J2U3_9HELO|nr:hypothetical protein DID88_007608 [Monilinia fructigena]
MALRLRRLDGIDKETAAASFNDWWNALLPNTVTIFSDGSESYDDAGKHVGYGYAIYQGQALVATGKGAINTLSHVFDAEAIGALKGLQKALTLPSNADTQRWLCIDSTSVIWCKRANASDTSQWAFLESHRLIDRHAVNIRWSPGHQGITGNEAADSLADAGAKSDIVDPGPTAQPTISGIGSIARSLAHNVTSGWWRKNEPTLSGGYRRWHLDYALKEPMELKLSRPTLHRLLALRSRHGDFEAYHKRFKHEDAETHCPCGKAKTPEHLVFCEISDAPSNGGRRLPNRARVVRDRREEAASVLQPSDVVRHVPEVYYIRPHTFRAPAQDVRRRPPTGAPARNPDPTLAACNETALRGYAHPVRSQAKGSTKEAAAEQFNTWWSQLSDNTITVFSDGSEQYKDGAKLVGYGYAIYRGQSLVRTGSGAINSISHVFDAEAIGALKGLQCALEILRPLDEHIWMCIDSTSVIWCMRANASNTSQWAFLECHALIDQFKVGIRWSPGHMGIEGNETADELADAGANEGRMDDDRSAEPTISGIGTTARALADAATSDWWSRCLTGLSASYRKWGLGYSIAEPPELRLPRTLLHRLLAARTAHGDFAQYHRRFGHTDAELNCLCGYAKTPEHLVFCEISQRKVPCLAGQAGTPT